MFYQSALVVTAKKQVCILDKNKGFECLDVSPSQWHDETVVLAVGKIAQKQHWNSISLVLADDFCYNLVLSYPEDGVLSSDYVQKELAKILPENINQLLWDYEVVKISEEKKLIQVLAISSSQISHLDGLVNKAKLPVQSIRSYACGIAKLVKEKDSVLVISRLEKLLVGTLVYNKVVIYSKILNEETFSSEIKYLLDLIKHYDLPEVSQLLINTDGSLPKLSDLDKKIKVKGVKFDLASSSIFKQKMKEEDDPSLGFDINEITSFLLKTKENKINLETEDASEEQKQVVINKPKAKLTSKISKDTIKKIVALIILTILLIGMGYLAYQKIRPDRFEKPADKTVEIIEPIITPATTQPEEKIVIATESAEFNPAVYKINILNGSGRSGEAAAVAETLMAEGYEDIEVGNASSNYVETEIAVIDKALFDNLKKILQTKYNVSSSSAKLDESSLFDARVIIGKELTE